MKTGFRSFGLCAAFLSTLVHSFPTVENFGKLMAKSDVTVEELLEHVTILDKKRATTDYLATPVSGEEHLIRETRWSIMESIS
jgi:hypothetical protein